VLYAWVSKFKKADESSTNDLKVLQADMAKFKSELRRITEERDILKKAGWYFTKQSG
jgi:transposase